MKNALVLISLLLFTVISAHASPITMGGLIFTHYEYVLSDDLSNGVAAHDYNAFDVSRIYLNAATSLNSRFDSFLQVEADLLSRDNTANQVYLKQAWLKWNQIYCGASLLFGLIPSPWRSFEESVWKYRFVAKIMDDEEGLLSATDRGVSLGGQIPYVAYEAMISNGEGTGGRGTSGNETTKYKDMALRASVSPFSSNILKPLKLNMLEHRGFKMADWPRNRTFGGLSYETKTLTLWSAYYFAKDGYTLAASTGSVTGNGLSVYVIVTVPGQPSCIFIRWDRYDPNTRTEKDSRQRFIYGLSHQLAEGVKISLDHQILKQEMVSESRADQNIVSTHLEIKF